MNKSIVSDIRGLSSGTVSKLLRDAFFDAMRDWLKSKYNNRRTMTINPLLSQDGEVIDRVQYAFMAFVVSSDQRFESWIDAWKAYLRRMEDVSFKVSYMGASEFTIRGYNKTIEYKSSTSKYEQSVYNGDENDYVRSVVGKVGCSYVYYGATTGFPPENIACLFPLYTPAMWNDGWIQNPEWPKAKHGVDACGGICAWHHDVRFDYKTEQWEEWREFAMSDRTEEKEELRELVMA